jgi:hypothetical protein
MASRNRSATAVVPGAPAKLLPRKGKDGFVADNVFAISSVVPEEVRAGVDVFDGMDAKAFRRCKQANCCFFSTAFPDCFSRCLQIACRVASGDAVDERLLSETGAIAAGVAGCMRYKIML